MICLSDARVAPVRRKLGQEGDKRGENHNPLLPSKARGYRRGFCRCGTFSMASQRGRYRMAELSPFGTLGGKKRRKHNPITYVQRRSQRSSCILQTGCWGKEMCSKLHRKELWDATRARSMAKLACFCCCCCCWCCKLFLIDAR